MKTTAAPIRVDPAFSNREEIHELFLRQGPSPAAAACLAKAQDPAVPQIPLCDAWIASIYKIHTAASRGSAPRVD
jgi:hypothetical protein